MEKIDALYLEIGKWQMQLEIAQARLAQAKNELIAILNQKQAEEVNK